jgi:hypothetical protein
MWLWPNSGIQQFSAVETEENYEELVRIASVPAKIETDHVHMHTHTHTRTRTHFENYI